MTIPLENQLNTILTPVCGEELYPIGHPDPDGSISSVATTYTIFTVVGGQSFNTLEGDAGISRVRLQISIYAVDYTEFKAIQRAIAAAMQAANVLANGCIDLYEDVYSKVGALKNISVGVPTEGKEPDTKRFYVHQEYYIWTQE